MQTIQTSQAGKQFGRAATTTFYPLSAAENSGSIGPPKNQPDSEKKKPEDDLPGTPDPLDDKVVSGSNTLTH